MATETLTISKGFTLIEKKQIVSPYVALNILSTQKQARFTKAEYIPENDTFEFTRHVAVCSSCNSHIPAYKHAFQKYTPYRRVSKANAYEFCAIDSLFTTGMRRVLPIHTALSTNTEALTCPICEKSAKISNESEQIWIEHQPRKITVKSAIDSLADVLAVDLYRNIEIQSFPLYELICFDLKRHKVFIKLLNRDGSSVVTRDITSGLDFEKQNSKFSRLINENVLLKQKLARLFKRYGAELPFRLNELNLQKFIVGTAFVGYNKSFYSNIPCINKNESIFDPSFKSQRSKLAESANCIELLKDSSLPQTKSFRKTFFENCELFFYLPEIESLFKIFKDPNLLLSFFGSANCRPILNLLHDHIGIAEFFNDFSQCKSPTMLLNLLTEYDSNTYEYGLFYASLTLSKKKLEKKRWNEKDNSFRNDFWESLNEYEASKELFEYEDEAVDLKIKDSCCEGYEYIHLKSPQQQYTAGCHLANCLRSNYYRTHILGIMKNGRYLAAVEVNAQRAVEQAYLKNNKSISESKAIYSSLKKFCKKNNILL